MGDTSCTLYNLLVLFTLSILSSCACQNSDSVYLIKTVYDPCEGIDIRTPDGTRPEELAAIDAAIEYWNAVSNVKISQSFSPPDQTLDVSFEDAALMFRGVYEDELGDVYVNRRLSNPKDMAITIAHELGHALGLPHINSRDSVMNEGNLEFEPLELDVAALADLWGPCVRNRRAPQADLGTPVRIHTLR